MIQHLTYTSKNLYIFNQIKSRSTYLLSSLSTTSLYTRCLCFLVNALTFIESIYWDYDTDKANIRIRKKLYICLTSFLSLLSLGVLNSGIFHDLISRQSIRKLIIWIICNSVGKNTPSYICMSKKTTYYKPMMLLIQYRLIENVNCKVWFKKFLMKVDQEGYVSKMTDD